MFKKNWLEPLSKGRPWKYVTVPDGLKVITREVIHGSVRCRSENLARWSPADPQRIRSLQVMCKSHVLLKAECWYWVLCWLPYGSISDLETTRDLVGRYKPRLHFILVNLWEDPRIRVLCKSVACIFYVHRAFTIKSSLWLLFSP